MRDQNSSDDQETDADQPADDDTDPVRGRTTTPDSDDTGTTTPEQNRSAATPESSEGVPGNTERRDENETPQSRRTDESDDETHPEPAEQRDGTEDDHPDDGGAAAPEDTELTARLSTIEETVEQSRERIEELEDSLDDYQRRNEYQHEELRKYALEDFAREILTVKDNLQDAVELEDLPEETEHRLRILDKQFEQVFTTGQIDKIDPSPGDEYDNDRHRMMDKEESDAHEKEEIVRVIEAGYTVSDRVIRSARVVVAK